MLAKGAAVALLSSAIPYSLELAALRRLRASVFGVLMSLEPAMGAISGLFFLGQRLALREWLAVGRGHGRLGRSDRAGPGCEPLASVEALG